MTPIRVMIVDDHAIVRDGLQALLTQQAELDVVGLAADGTCFFGVWEGYG